jgi:hypothetical protein
MVGEGCRTGEVRDTGGHGGRMGPWAADGEPGAQQGSCWRRSWLVARKLQANLPVASRAWPQWPHTIATTVELPSCRRRPHLPRVTVNPGLPMRWRRLLVCSGLKGAARLASARGGGRDTAVPCGRRLGEEKESEKRDGAAQGGRRNRGGG